MPPSFHYQSYHHRRRRRSSKAVTAACLAVLATAGVALFLGSSSSSSQSPSLSLSTIARGGRPMASSSRSLLAKEGALGSRNRCVQARSAASISTPVKAATSSLQGLSREQNEDRYQVLNNPGASEGQIENFIAVYDGHGGDGTAIWLTENFFSYIERAWSASDPKSSMIRAYEEADEEILKPRGGVFGIGAQRGIGGSKCGSTAATVTMFTKDGKKYAVVANIGDSMVLRKSGSEITPLSTEHVPDNEEERKRIEMYNPNPKMPLVRYVESTWRVGGLLALSRAFGDAYLKPSLDFEGVGYQDSDYMSGFGLIARPDVEVVEIKPSDEYLIVASDGLFQTEVRGGGGGLEYSEVQQIIDEMKGSAPEQISAKLASAAQQAGSTDDVTVVVVSI